VNGAMADPRTAKTPLFATDGVSWLGLSAGPLAWFFDQQASYYLAGWSCRAGHHWATCTVTAAAFALALSGAIMSWRDWQRQGDAGDTDNRCPARARFFALSALLLCSLFGLVVLLDLAAKLNFDPCQR
jgi:hypothetical protein